MIRKLLAVAIVGFLFVGTVAAQGLPTRLKAVEQPKTIEAKNIGEMSVMELLMAKNQIEENAKRLTISTLSTKTIIDELMSYLRGRRSVLIEDNNRVMQAFQLQLKQIHNRLAELSKKRPEKKGVKKGGK